MRWRARPSGIKSDKPGGHFGYFYFIFCSGEGPRGSLQGGRGVGLLLLKSQNSERKFQGGPGRFGSVTVRLWNGSSGSGIFSVSAVPLGKGFPVFPFPKLKEEGKEQRFRPFYTNKSSELNFPIFLGKMARNQKEEFIRTPPDRYGPSSSISNKSDKNRSERVKGAERASFIIVVQKGSFGETVVSSALLP